MAPRKAAIDGVDEFTPGIAPRWASHGYSYSGVHEQQTWEAMLATWVFEPGHSAAHFRARHMMVTDVRGAFKNVNGSLTFDPENPQAASVQVTIDATQVWTGEPDRDAHLRSADFLDVDHHPQITFHGDRITVIGKHDYTLEGNLTIRGVTRPTSLRVKYLGQWPTPWWEQENGDWVDKGPKARAGFIAETEINRQDFGVSWNDSLDKGGVVVGDIISITIDAEAIRQSD